jgi:hypothetical protein
MAADITDITPPRLSAVDIASLDARECRAALLLLAGHEDPAIAAAVTEAVARVLSRTRSGGQH